MPLNDTQRWILFFLFVSAFIFITVFTIGALFFDLGTIAETYKEKLFYALIVEVVGAIILLFWSAFGLREKERLDSDDTNKTIWLDFDAAIDISELIDRKAIISPRSETGMPLGEDIVNTILKERGGLYIKPVLPSDTESVFVTINISDKQIYEGSFPVKSYVVKLEAAV